VPTKTKIPLGIFLFLCTEGFERAEAKQDNFQQKVIAACVDECDRRSIQLCPGQGTNECRRVSDA
jgi:hypothetical protein